MDNLQDRYNRLKEALWLYKVIQFISGIIGFLGIAIIILSFFMPLPDVIGFKDDNEFYLSTIIIFALLTFWYLSSKRAHDFEVEIRDISNQIDLEQIDVTSIEARAEKLFKLHQYELEKYYNQNLRQGSQVFYGGLLFIIIGFIIIAISLYLVAYGEVKNSGMVAILGAVGTILSNFIAAIYLKMFSETTKSATSFHNRLVSTHNLMFSNFIASKIKNGDLREKTYSDVATHLGNMKFEKEEAQGEEQSKDKPEEKK